MKNFELKYFAMIMAFGMLWSCQTEQAFSDVVATTKKVPVADGVASAADDQYRFDKIAYVYAGNVIKDTIQIKEMLKNANALYINGDKREIFLTKDELNKLLEACVSALSFS